MRGLSRSDAGAEAAGARLADAASGDSARSGNCVAGDVRMGRAKRTLLIVLWIVASVLWGGGMFAAPIGFFAGSGVLCIGGCASWGLSIGALNLISHLDRKWSPPKPPRRMCGALSPLSGSPCFLDPGHGSRRLFGGTRRHTAFGSGGRPEYWWPQS